MTTLERRARAWVLSTIAASAVAGLALAGAPPSASFPVASASPSAAPGPPPPSASAPAPAPPTESAAPAPSPPASSAPPPPAPPAPSGAPAPASARAMPAPARLPTQALVHLSASYAGAVLELRSYIDATEWRPVCAAPCDRPLEVEGTEARVSAPGMTTSNVFRIEPGRGTASFRVEGGSQKSRQIGVIGFGGGLPVALVGMGMWGYGKVEDQAGLRTAGIVTLGVGAVMVLGSLPFLGAGKTIVRDGKGAVIARGFSPPPM